MHATEEQPASGSHTHFVVHTRPESKDARRERTGGNKLLAGELDVLMLANLNPLTWPELLRQYFTHEDEADLVEGAGDAAAAALEKLRTSEYTSLTFEQKLAVLRLCLDAAAGTVR